MNTKPERHRFFRYEHNGKSEFIAIDDTAEFARGTISKKWEYVRALERFLSLRLSHAHATLSKKDFDLFCLDIGISAGITLDGEAEFEILPLGTNSVAIDWPDPLNEFATKAKELIEGYWKLSEVVWEVIEPILDKMMQAISTEEFDVFCAEIGVYNERDANGQYSFALLPPEGSNYILSSEISRDAA
jgi:hypothetical protein